MSRCPSEESSVQQFCLRMINITLQGRPAEIFCKCQQNLFVGSACCKEDGLVWHFFACHPWSFSWPTHFKKKSPVQKLFAHVLDFRAPDLLLLQWEKTGVKFSFANHSDQFLGTIYCKVWFDNLFVNDPDHLLGRPITKKRSATPLITSTFYLSAPKSCGSHLYLRAIPCRPLNIPALPHSIARTLPSLRSGITLFRSHKHLRQWIPPIIYSF